SRRGTRAAPGRWPAADRRCRPPAARRPRRRRRRRARGPWRRRRQRRNPCARNDRIIRTEEARVALADIRNFVAIDRGDVDGDRLATAGQPSEAQLREVAAAGFQVVVNLGLTGTDYALPDEAGLAAALGLEYHHLPVLFDAPRVDDLRAFVAVM